MNILVYGINSAQNYSKIMITNYIPKYDPDDYKNPEVGFHSDGLWLRPAVVKSVDPKTGLVDVNCLDYPGIKTGLVMTQAHQGIFQAPTIGSVVLLGFGQGYNPYILRYVPVGYGSQISAGKVHPILAGELMLVSYLDSKVREKQVSVPVETGTLFYMNNVGNIDMKTAKGSSWGMNNEEDEISQSSMNYKVSTEAGILEFGLTKRHSIITTNGLPIEESSSGTTPEGLTEFRLRVLDKADANPLTEPEVDNPFIELTLGVKVDDGGEIVKTTPSHAKTTRDAQQIIIQLKTKAEQGFEFTVDRQGNVTLQIKGNTKIKVGGDTDISVTGNTNLDVKGDIIANAASIQLAGTSQVVLSNFLKIYNTHTHPVTGTGVPSGAPILLSTDIHKSKVVKVK